MDLVLLITIVLCIIITVLLIWIATYLYFLQKVRRGTRFFNFTGSNIEEANSFTGINDALLLEKDSTSIPETNSVFRDEIVTTLELDCFAYNRYGYGDMPVIDV